jgi:hypothetical protein
MRALPRPSILNPVAQRRLALLFPIDDLLGWTLEAVLSTAYRWEVQRLSPLVEEDVLLDQLSAYDPVVVIVGRDDPALVAAVQPWLRQARAGGRLITLSLDSNVVETYVKQQACMHQAADLLCILENTQTVLKTWKEVD